jgi:hypothetical protein
MSLPIARVQIGLLSTTPSTPPGKPPRRFHHFRRMRMLTTLSPPVGPGLTARWLVFLRAFLVALGANELVAQRLLEGGLG